MSPFVTRSTTLSTNRWSGWLREHPVAGFVLLAFGISYLLGLPVLLVFSGWFPFASPLLQTYLPRILVVYGPGLAALILTRLAVGGPGIPLLLRRLLPARPDLPWALAILGLGAGSSTAALLFSGVEAAVVLSVLRANGALLLAHLALQILIVAVGEELGWRGWLLPRLLERTTRLRATLLTAGLWGLWHGPLLLSGFLTASLFLLGVFGLAVLFTWFWAHTQQRLFVVVWAHAVVNTPLFFWEQASAGYGDNLLLAWYFLEAFYAGAALVVLVLGWRWWIGRSLPTE